MGLLDDAQQFNAAQDYVRPDLLAEWSRKNVELADQWARACALIPNLAREFAAAAIQTAAGKNALRLPVDEQGQRIFQPVDEWGRRVRRDMWPVTWTYGTIRDETGSSVQATIAVFVDGSWLFASERWGYRGLEYLLAEQPVPAYARPSNKFQQEVSMWPSEASLNEAFVSALAPLIR